MATKLDQAGSDKETEQGTHRTGLGQEHITGQHKATPTDNGAQSQCAYL